MEHRSEGAEEQATAALSDIVSEALEEVEPPMNPTETSLQRLLQALRSLN